MIRLLPYRDALGAEGQERICRSVGTSARVAQGEQNEIT
jgi:hypothetical protein